MIKLTYPLDQLDSYPGIYTPGTRGTTNDGNEYIYLDGVASCAKYDWVTISTRAKQLSYGSVTRLAANAIGDVGIAQAACVNNKCGWFLIKGIGWGNSASTSSSGSMLYASGTTGCITGAITAGGLVLKAVAVTAGSGAATGTVGVLIEYPFITNMLG